MRRRKYDNKNIIIVSILFVFLITVGYSAFNTNLNINTKGNIKDHVWNFDYTGSEQSFTVPTTGNYKIEVWGAQGQQNVSTTSKNRGGNGGYATGIIILPKSDKIYISVGSAGSFKGYNGGGINIRDTSDLTKTGNQPTGGGATSITSSLINDGKLSNYENNKNDIIIVAGGGGGGEWTGYTDTGDIINSGGSGGGFKGANGSDKCNNNKGFGVDYFGYYGYGGTQTNGGHTITYSEVTSINSSYIKKAAQDTFDGTFGQGGHTENGDGAGGGGGGFYGGGASNYACGGGGGSGYIGNNNLKEKYMTCYNCEESNEEFTKTISVTCASETPTKDCAKIGNGYARITYLGK